jgi:chromosome segregation ATPase
MEHKEMKSKVGKSATKIWEAYQEALNELKSKENGHMISTIAVAQEQKKEAAVKTAAVVNVANIDTVVSGLLKNVEEAKNTFDELQLAINAKKAELQAVHGLEAEANALVALVATKDKLVAQRELEAQTIIENARVKAEELRKEAEEFTATTKANVNAEMELAAKQREREQEEYEYKFGREKKAKLDEVEDQINQKVKELKERADEVKAREALADEKDAELDQLKNLLEKLEASTALRVEDAVQKAKEKAATSANIAKAMDKRSHEADMMVRDAEVKTLKDQLADYRTRLETANNQVNAANIKVAEMAQSALRAQGDAATISKVSEIAAGANKK